MIAAKLLREETDRLINTSILEDLGRDEKCWGDVTSFATVPRKKQATFQIKAKEPGIVCGLKIAEQVFKKLDADHDIKFEAKAVDGQKIRKNHILASIQGNCRNILMGERTALNFLQHLSGIATLTATFVAAAAPAKVLDTRKTIPGLRLLEKYAVACGGGTNHRMGLYDMVLIKDNHIVAAGGIEKALAGVKTYWHGNGKGEIKVEVECSSLAQVKEALPFAPTIIMLDNMTEAQMKKAVFLVSKKTRILLEASGNMTLNRVRKVGKSGVDFISVGALTHSAKALDISMELVA